MINLTKHFITLRSMDGTDIVIAPSGNEARVATVEEIIGVCPITSVLIVHRTWGEVYGLPEEGTPCIVSSLVASAVPGRAGVFCPDTGTTAIKDETGFVLAATRLVEA